MKIKLFHKLLIALFACTAMVLLLIIMVTRASIHRGFVDFLQQQDLNKLELLIPDLAGIYSEGDSWAELEVNPGTFYSLLFTIAPSGAERGPGSGPGSRRQSATPGSGRRGLGRGGFGAPPGAGNALHQRVFLLSVEKVPVIGHLPPDFDHSKLLAIKVDGTAVGWLGVASPPGLGLPAEEAFIQHQRNTLFFGLGIGLVMAAMLAWLLARHLSRPVEAVAGGIRALASGKFETRLEIPGSDEIALLGRDVNRLSAALKDHETIRKQWMSDIAHELRTPLAIISGELEAMNDGIRPLDKEQLGSVRDEVSQLTRLVNDLHSLALTDSGALVYKFEVVDFGELVQLVVDSFQSRAAGKELELSLDIPEQTVRVQGDEHRLRQLLGNLLENTVCYTDAGGRVAISLKVRKGRAYLNISDTAPGVEPDECRRLFERLYRPEASRNRNSGGSGLGLSICRNIVEAHGGEINAEPGPDGGLLVSTMLPLER